MAYPAPTLEPVAIIGSGCRFAGDATSPRKLWSLLSKPTDLSRPVPSDRFAGSAFHHHDGEYHGTTNSPRAYWLDQDHRAFDAQFFNITPKEAEAIDPQQRLLLEVVYEALESAGYGLQHYAGRNVAVFAGLMTGDYDTLSARDELNASQYAATGNARSIISNRLSYFFDFHGPSMTIDTACSASLVALHQAVQSLRSGESPMACVAGVNLMLTPEQFIAESSLHMLSPTGHSRMWDSKADGYARGEGVAAIFIKTLSQALADGDNIQAVIRDTGVNSDGRTQGITMPNPHAQTVLIQETYRKSGLDPLDPTHRPQFFEAHGTGTPVGDRLEAQAICNAFFSDDIRNKANRFLKSSSTQLLVGSVKTVIGHTEGAAGLAGLLKVVQSMEQGFVPPNMHLDSLSPSILPFSDRLYIPTSLTSWPRPAAGQPRRSSINSFGFGGTNAHTIIEGYDPVVHIGVARLFNPKLPKDLEDPLVPLRTSPGVTLPLLISASSEVSLRETLYRYKHFLLDTAGVSCEQLGSHLFQRRTAHTYRIAIVADTLPEAALAVESGVGTRSKHLQARPRILGIFTGQGAQYAGMSQGLWGISSVFRDTIKSLDDILQACADPPGWSIQEQLMLDKDSSQLGVAAISQPLCAALQIGLVDFLNSIGISFACVVGHSSGEVAAAYAAGRITQKEAMLIAYYRGRYADLASGTEGQAGGMLACGLSKKQAEDFCSRTEYKGRICVAVSNSPTLVTLSGDFSAVESAFTNLKEQSIFARMLNVDTAYHSFHMRRPIEEYSKALEACKLNAGSSLNGNGTRWISSVYGTRKTIDAEDLAVKYWGDNMMRPVLFQEALTTALHECGTFDCAIEVGPHPALRSPVKETMAAAVGTGMPYTFLLDRTKEDRLTIADFIGVMWTNFGPSSIDVRSYVLNSPQPQLAKCYVPDTPSYAWDHSQTYWRESRVSEQYHFRKHPPNELLGVRTRDDTKFDLRWRNILKLDKLPWLAGHKFQGQALLPAAAYCSMAFEAAKIILAGRKANIIELHDLEFLSGIIVEPESLGVEILFHLSMLSSDKPAAGQPPTIDAEFKLTSTPAKSSGFSPMKLNFRGKLRVILEDEDSFHPLPRRDTKPRAETLPVNVDAFYQMMEDMGLGYTGPFRALKQIDRRLNFACATLDARHSLDRTTLEVSPAALDSCFQATLATFSSPGDKALWTSFLPTKIGLIRFNLDAHGSLLFVESHLTDFKPYSRASPAKITADLSIFNEHDQMSVQVENLTVSSFASTKPEDDYELYLHTVLELDPEDEIVAPASSRRLGLDPALAESCERVAQHFAQQPPSTALLDTPPASPIIPDSPDRDDMETFPALHHSPAKEAGMQRFIQTSPYFETLDHIRNVGRQFPEMVPNILPVVMKKAQALLYLQSHLEGVVRQISHCYPRMKVLGLTDAKLSLTEYILNGLGDNFSSYRIGSKPERNLHDRLPLLKSNKKVREEYVDPKSEESDTEHPTDLYDMVILSASAFQDDMLSSLKVVRTMTKNGGFLIFIDSDLKPPSKRLVARAIFTESPQNPPILPPVSLNLPDEYDFVKRARNADYHDPLGFSLVVRQAGGSHRGAWRDQSTWPTNQQVTEHVLIIGGDTQAVKVTATGLEDRLKSHCTLVSMAEKLDHVTPEMAAACTGVILLFDLEEPLCPSMTAEKLEGLRSIVRPEMVILWVTRNARSDPDRAASLGLTRTLKAETPDLLLQVLDLDSLNGSSSIILETFYRMTYCAQSRSINDPGSTAWTSEPEIHIENGKRLVPRVLPYKPANDRLNAYRRSVTKTVNTLHTAVGLDISLNSDGSTRYEASDVGRVKQIDGSWRINVEHSSVCAFSIAEGEPIYLCVGTEVNHGNLMVGLSKTLASIVNIDQALCRVISNFNVDPVTFIDVLSHALRAVEIHKDRLTDCLVLVEADAMLLRSLQILSSGNHKHTNLHFHVLSREDGSRLCGPNKDPGVTYVHQMATSREVRRALPNCQRAQSTGCTVFDFLPGGNQLSKTLMGLQENIEYHHDSKLFQNLGPASSGKIKSEKKMADNWNLAMAIAFETVTKHVDEASKSTFITPSELLNRTVPVPCSAIIDWKSARDLDLPVAPVVQMKRFRSDRTYVLFGLTRDLGQSICRLLIDHGARHIIVASRNPDKNPAWVAELNEEGAHTRVQRCDVTILRDVIALAKTTGGNHDMPTVGGVVNGAMVLDDRVFAQMDITTWHRVMRPKTIGSRNLDRVFASPDLDFLVMTSSFAAIGGHAGQSNYAAANMYMNGVAASRRRRGLAGSVLNIGVIYGLGLLARERQDVYAGLERDGYPPISERDIHHMFLEAVEAGRPVPGQINDLTTGLARFRVDDPDPQHWHRDLRFCHFTLSDNGEGEGAAVLLGSGEKSIGDQIRDAETVEAAAEVLVASLCRRMEVTLQLPGDSVDGDRSIVELGVDSLAGVEIRNWFYKSVGADVPVMKILGASSISSLCREIAGGINPGKSSTT